MTYLNTQQHMNSQQNANDSKNLIPLQLDMSQSNTN